MSARRALLLVVLSLAALASWYVARDSGDGDAEQAAARPAMRGYYLEDARILGTGADGRLLYEILAERAEQTGDDQIRFSTVQVRYSPDSDVPWVLTARTATLYPDRPEVQLEGDVRATSSSGFSGQATEILAETMTLDPERYEAETADRIEVRIGDRSLTGTGMLASWKENRMEIRSNVSGRFLP